MQNPLITIAESWLVRLISVAGVAIFGDKVFTNTVALNVAGVVMSALVFAFNEGLHYLKTNKQVATAVSDVKTEIASDPALATSLSQLQASLKTLESTLTPKGTSNVQS